MKHELQELQKRYFELIDTISFVAEDLDYRIVDRHISFLEKLDSIGNSAISIFDMFKKTHVYISSNYKKWLKLDDSISEGLEGFDMLMHPEDLVVAVEAGYYFLEMAMNMENDRLHDFKLVNDYRIRKSDNSWIRVEEQHRILETDPYGNIWLALSIVDVSPNQNIEAPMQSRLLHQKTGELHTFFPNNGKLSPIRELTRREKQILALLSKGYISKQIAEQLHLSIHTINTHRQNIIGKMEVTNTAEAIRYASKLGLL